MKKIICIVLSVFMVTSMFFVTINATVTGLKGDTNYYIMNVYTESYISLYSSSTSSSLDVVGRNKDNNVNLSKWKIVFNTDGSVQIVDLENRALTVDEATNEVYVSTNSNATNQQFNITRIDNSSIYRGTYFIKYNNLYLHCTPDNSIKLFSATGVNSRWSIYESEKGNSYLYNYYVLETNNGVQEILATDLSSSYYNNAISSLGYANTEFKNKSALTIYSRMKKNIDLLCIATHGVQDNNEAGLSMLACNNGTSTEEGETSYLSAGNAIPQVLELSPYYSIDSLSSNIMASCRCVFLIGCSTGDSITYNGSTYSLLESLYNKGVHCAVGTSETISGGDIGLFNYYMQQLLITEVHNGKVEELLESINEKYLAQNFNQQEFPFVVYGDVHQYLKFN